ncbi:collagen-like triple helix repeat-containing protein [Pareuzebyella sediminis]|uniref:collagen-like triple helix repeat-containing protein n=1 Tax=Pareuzebyella sediminis TaxID=2607998 RepID=UPI0011EE6484|nr:collagen-like protein [Pareuzebyella sediminis]
MRKTSLLIGTFLTLFLISCEGPQGPPGFDGLDGPQGPAGEDGIEGQVFEIDGVDFAYDPGSNLQSAIINFEDNTDFEVFESDAVLVYRFDGEIELNDGSLANAWSLIPQNFFTADGTIQYTSAHNFVDVEIFIDGNYDLANLSPDFTQNQFFRVVIVPSVFLTSKIDKSNISSVMSALGVQEKDVRRISLN